MIVEKSCLFDMQRLQTYELRVDDAYRIFNTDHHHHDRTRVRCHRHQQPGDNSLSVNFRNTSYIELLTSAIPARS